MIKKHKIKIYSMEAYQPYSGFKCPNKERRDKALGNMTNECPAIKKALENIEQYWEPIKVP